MAEAMSREDLLLLQLKSGCAAGTIRNWQRGRARPASAKRIEAALAVMAREREAPPASVQPTAAPSKESR
jgi:hypothetical protein